MADDVKRSSTAASAAAGEAQGGAGDETKSTGSARSSTAVTFTQFARRFFNHKGADAHRHQRTVLHGPLLKQIWGDGDAEVIRAHGRSLISHTLSLYFYVGHEFR